MLGTTAATLQEAQCEEAQVPRKIKIKIAMTHLFASSTATAAASRACPLTAFVRQNAWQEVTSVAGRRITDRPGGLGRRVRKRLRSPIPP